MYLPEGKAPIYLHTLDKVYVRNMFYYCHTVQERGIEKHVLLLQIFPEEKLQVRTVRIV